MEFNATTAAKTLVQAVSSHPFILPVFPKDGPQEVALSVQPHYFHVSAAASQKSVMTSPMFIAHSKRRRADSVPQDLTSYLEAHSRG